MQQPTDFARYARLRARAWWITLPFVLVGGLLLCLCVLSLHIGGSPDPFGMIPFVVLCALVAVAWLVTRVAWRDARAARPVTQRLDPTTGEIVNDADAPPSPHRGLTGRDEPPARW